MLDLAGKLLQATSGEAELPRLSSTAELGVQRFPGHLHRITAVSWPHKHGFSVEDCGSGCWHGDECGDGSCKFAWAGGDRGPATDPNRPSSHCFVPL